MIRSLTLVPRPDLIKRRDQRWCWSDPPTHGRL